MQSRVAEEDDEADGANYQLEMMRCLREVNVDNNTVGWCGPPPEAIRERFRLTDAYRSELA